MQIDAPTCMQDSCMECSPDRDCTRPVLRRLLRVGLTSTLAPVFRHTHDCIVLSRTAIVSAQRRMRLPTVGTDVVELPHLPLADSPNGAIVLPEKVCLLQNSLV